MRGMERTPFLDHFPQSILVFVDLQQLMYWRPPSCNQTWQWKILEIPRFTYDFQIPIQNRDFQWFYDDYAIFMAMFDHPKPRLLVNLLLSSKAKRWSRSSGRPGRPRRARSRPRTPWSCPLAPRCWPWIAANFKNVIPSWWRTVNWLFRRYHWGYYTMMGLMIWWFGATFSDPNCGWRLALGNPRIGCRSSVGFSVHGSNTWNFGLQQTLSGSSKCFNF